MTGIKQWIEVDTQFEVLHYWAECPYEDVSFLRNIHRHKVFVKVRIDTTADREIEFFRFKQVVDAAIDDLYGSEKLKNIGSKSMEAVAKSILFALRQPGFYRHDMVISVSEDDQVRAILEYTH